MIVSAVTSFPDAHGKWQAAYSWLDWSQEQRGQVFLSGRPMDGLWDSLFRVFCVPPVAGMFESTGIDLRLAAQVALYKTCLRFGAEFSVSVCLGVLKIIDCFLGFSPESISTELR
jgi:hypothetical protein